ncbi:MAG: type III-B CRISPR module RAMP protein Cmr6 [Opitutales bacterium]|nr:type III-B CRISPR module RAMP protein Cmr6 [Opitutales bacterium]
MSSRNYVLLHKYQKGDTPPSGANRGLFLSKYAGPNLVFDNNKQEWKKQANENALNKGVGLKSNTSKLESFHDWAKDLKGRQSFTLRTQARLLIDMAGGVLENANINLDRISGEPFISGSAVKGCSRASVLAELREWSTESGSPGEQLKQFSSKKAALVAIARVFGVSAEDFKGDGDYKWAVADDTEVMAAAQKALGLTDKVQSLAGKVAFLPAYPRKSGTKLELDVLTSHHQKYYGGSIPATDTENPIPVLFPAVPEGTEFCFYVLTLHGGSDEDTKNAAAWLSEGLKNCGIGAKTSAGYGWFGEGSGQSASPRIDTVAIEKGIEVIENKYEGDYTEVTFQNKIMELAKKPNLFNKLVDELETLKKPENKTWLKRFLEETESGKNYKALHGKNWYTDLKEPNV